MFAFGAFVACSLVALGNACCSPKQWEGVADAHKGLAGRYERRMVEDLTYLAYDAVNQRSASLKSVTEGDKITKTKNIKTYAGQSGKEYVIDLLAKTCEVKNIPQPFSEACIPGDAKDYGSFFIGEKGGLKAEFFRVISPDTQNFLRYTAVQMVQPKACIPLVEQVMGRNQEGEDTMSTIIFADIVTKITNESFFEPPSYCEDKAFNLFFARNLEKDNSIFYF